MEKPTDEERIAYCRDKGIDPRRHCCLDLAWFICHPVEGEYKDLSPVILWLRPWNEYRLHLSHDGFASTRIDYCPWCGTKLPADKEQLWYETLHRMGYANPAEDDIPPEFRTDQWWRALDEKAE
jgi:hypothetical protein